MVFGKKGIENAPSVKKESLGTRPFTYADIKAHCEGSTIHNDLNRPEVRDLLNRWEQTGIDSITGDSSVRTKLLQEINEVLGRSGQMH